jgi:hypothetical protein
MVVHYSFFFFFLDANALDISGFPWDSARLLLIVCIIGVLAGCFYYAWTSARDALRELRTLERQHLLESELNEFPHKKKMRTMHANRPASPATMALLTGATLCELEEKRRRTSPLHGQRNVHHSAVSHSFYCTPSPPRLHFQTTNSSPLTSSPIGLGVRGLSSLTNTSKSTCYGKYPSSSTHSS